MTTPLFVWNPYSLLILCNGVLALVIGGFIWSRRPGRGVTTIALLSLALAGWSFANALQIACVDPTWNYWLRHPVFLGVSLVPPLWFAFIAEYTGNEHWLTRRTFLLLAIEPILLQLAIATNPQHNLLWSEVVANPVPNTIPALEYYGGVLFWVHAAYSYTVMGVATVLLLRAFVRTPQKYRGQIQFLLIAVLAPWIGNIIYLGGFSPLPEYVDITPMAFLITGVAAIWSVYHFQLLELAPVAHVSIFESMADAVFVLDQKNRVLDANPAALKILNLPAEKVIGMPGVLIFANQKTLVDRYIGVFEAKDEVTLNIRGETRIFDMQMAPLKNRSGEILGRTVMLHDITTIKEANQQLRIARAQAEEATRLKSEFLAMMSHELRTPLNAIEGFSSIMLSGMGVELSPRAQDMLTRISSNSRRLQSLVNDILDLSRIEAGRVEVLLKPISPEALAKQWEKDMGVLAQNKQLNFRVSVDSSLPAVIKHDHYALTKIATNLLSNAIKFTESGLVSLSLQRDGDQLQIIVTDSGIGIPEHAQDYIFEMFRQYDGTTTRQYGGSGLGLSLVRQLTHMLGGTVAVESEVGMGSTFTVSVPLNEYQLTNVEHEQKIAEGVLP